MGNGSSFTLTGDVISRQKALTHQHCWIRCR